MRGEDSAYATLGLRPGADRAEVDEAYRRLIKRYHPDRTGGDCGRAAEINRAYAQIRRLSAGPARLPRSVPVPVQPQRRATVRRRTGWMLASAIVVVAAFAVANDVPRRDSDRVAFDWPAPSHSPAPAAALPLADLEEPLQTAVIDRAVADAMRFHADADQGAAEEFSRACHNRLRDEPSLTWFDSCAAFDEATVIMNGANPFADSGRFSAPSIMARQMSAARLISDDVLAADSRLHQIRSRVELAILPRMEEPAAAR